MDILKLTDHLAGLNDTEKFLKEFYVSIPNTRLRSSACRTARNRITTA